MPTLSERIAELAAKADQLHGEVRGLFDEVNEGPEWDGIDVTSYLADVPGDMEVADNLASSLYYALNLAATNARRGGR